MIVVGIVYLLRNNHRTPREKERSREQLLRRVKIVSGIAKFVVKSRRARCRTNIRHHGASEALGLRIHYMIM